MQVNTITAFPDPAGFSSVPLTEILRNGARDLIPQAVEAELAALLEAHSSEVLPDVRARLVHHGHFPKREVMTGIGAGLSSTTLSRLKRIGGMTIGEA